MKNNVLVNLPEKTVDGFIKAYCNDGSNKGLDIPVSTTFPAQAQGNPFILVQFKQGVESKEDASIGNIQGSIYNAQQGDEVVKKLPVQVEDNKAYLELPEQAYDVYHVKEVTDFTFKDNRVYVPYFDFYKNIPHYMTVTYSLKTDKASADMSPIGIMEDEQVVVDFCSTNMDTLRCMVGLLTAISIYLKGIMESNSDIELPTINTEGTDLVMEVNSPTESVAGQQIFYRRMTISFKSLHTLPVNVGVKTDTLHIGQRLQNGEVIQDGTQN